MPLSICHVLQSLDPKTGGPPVIAWELAKAQQRRGQIVRMCAIDGVSDGVASQDARDGGSADKVPVVALPRPRKWESIAGQGPVRRSLKELICDADIVHLHGVWDPVLRLAALEAGAQGRPYLILVNGMLDPWSIRQKWLKKQLALALGYRRLLNHAARLHFGNRDEELLASPLGLRAEGVIIPNGIDLTALSPVPRGTFREHCPQLGNDPYVLFMGRLHIKKGLNYLADAFAAIAQGHPSAHLVVAGPDGGARAAFESQITKLRLVDRTHVVGPLYGLAKRAALRDAACLCLPSHQEGFSIALLEALASELPVVISEHCHFPEVAEHGAGRVVPLERDALAAALDELLADSELRARMGAAGRRLVESRYTWEKVAEKCDRVYTEIIASRSRPSAVQSPELCPQTIYGNP